MMYYKLTPVSKPPKKEGEFLMFKNNRHLGFVNIYDLEKFNGWFLHNNPNRVTHYLLEVSEEEHREERREVWEAAKKHWSYKHFSRNPASPDFDTFYNNKYKPEGEQ